jgi:hypothetical protein
MRIGGSPLANVAPFVPNVLKLTFNQHFGNATNIMNRLFFSFTGTLNEQTALNIATGAAAAWDSDFAPLLSTTYVLDTVVVTDMGSATGLQYTHPAALAGGLAAADYLPAQTSMCLTGVIQRRYRGGKPRWYQSGHHQTSLQDNQTFSALAIGQWEAAMVELIAAVKQATTVGGTITNNVSVSLVSGSTWTEYTTAGGKINYRQDPIYRTEALIDTVSIWSPLARVSNQRKRGKN